MIRWLAAAALLPAAVGAAPGSPGDPPTAAGRGPRVRLTAVTDAPPDVYTVPVPLSLVDDRDLRAPHHDYPASDLMVATGTPIFASHGGRVAVHRGEKCGRGVSVSGRDGIRYVYCHLSRVAVHTGSFVRTGDVLGLSGDTGNAAGVPHLHFHLKDRAGAYLCPQPLFLDWARGRQTSPRQRRVTTGCFF